MGSFVTQLALLMVAASIGTGLVALLPAPRRMALLPIAQGITAIALMVAVFETGWSESQPARTIEHIAVMWAVILIAFAIFAFRFRMSPTWLAWAGLSSGMAGAALATAEYLRSLHLVTRPPTSLLEAAQQLLAATVVQGGAKGAMAMLATGLAVWLGSAAGVASLMTFVMSKRLAERSGCMVLSRWIALALSTTAIVTIAWMIRRPVNDALFWLLLAVSLLLGLQLATLIQRTVVMRSLMLLSGIAGIAMTANGFVLGNLFLIAAAAAMAGIAVALAALSSDRISSSSVPS